MRHLLAYLVSIFILASPLVATSNPSEMNTHEILSELTSNMDRSEVISMGLHLDSVNWRKEHEDLSLNFEKTINELNSSLLKIGSLEMQVSSLQSQVTEAEDLSLNLNEDLQTANIKIQKQEIQIKTWRGVAIAASILAVIFGGIAILK